MTTTATESERSQTLLNAELACALVALEVLSTHAGLAFDRVAARRAWLDAQWDEGTLASANRVEQQLIAAAHRLGLRIERVELSFAQIKETLTGQLPVLVIDARDDESPARWQWVTRGTGRKVEVTDLGENRGRHWLRRDQWLSTLGVTSFGGYLTILAPVKALAYEHAASSQGSALKPARRLWKLLAPELRDIGVILIFSVVVGVLALATPISIEALVNTVAFGRLLTPLVVLSLVLLVFLGFAAAIRTLQAYVAEIIQRRLFVRVVADLAHRIPSARGDAFDHHHGTELINRFFDVLTVQKVVATLLLDGVAIIISTVVGMVVLGFYHPALLGFDAFLLICVLLTVFGLGRGAVRTSIEESRIKYRVAAWLETLAGSPLTFKLQAGADHAVEHADRLATQYVIARQSHFGIVLRQLVFALTMQAVAGTALLGLGGWLVIQGQITLGQLVAAELIVAVIVGSFAKMIKHLESFYDLMAAVDKLGHLFDLPLENAAGEGLGSSRAALAVTMHHATYEYHPGHTALAPISFRANPGERIAIVGESGSGKSTLLDLLFALREPSHGFIELDNTDMRSLRPAAVREVVTLARGIEIFAGTLAENIHLHRAGVGSRECRSALRAVGLWSEVQRLPAGLMTELQPSGAPLTRSQQIRLMLARAMVSQPRLLLIDGLLDELPDPLVEQVLKSVVEDREQSWTLIVASGRRSVIHACDRVIELSRPEHAVSGADHAAVAVSH